MNRPYKFIALLCIPLFLAAESSAALPDYGAVGTFALIVPLALATLYRALKGNFEAHKSIARWTFPIWLYVSVTGVVVYWMLY